MKKVIQMNHKVCDYECMWNGIEDLYQQKSGEKIPEFFFFCLSGIGNFVYLKSNISTPKRQAAWNDGRTKQMYQLVSDIIGFRYKYIEGRQFSYAMKKAKEQIDEEKPVVLGCTQSEYEEALRNIVMYTGTVPFLPNRLLGDEGEDNILHKASREKLASVLTQLGQEHKIEAWIKSAVFFVESGKLIEKMTNQMVEYLLKERSGLEEIPTIILEIANIEEKAFYSMLIGSEEEKR